METALTVLLMIVVFGLAFCVGGIPGYVLAKRRGLRDPIVAFVPLVGLWIVLFESIGRSGWLGLLAFVPYSVCWSSRSGPASRCLLMTDARAGGRPSSPSPCSTWSATGRTPSRSPSTSALQSRDCKGLLPDRARHRPSDRPASPSRCQGPGGRTRRSRALREAGKPALTNVYDARPSQEEARLGQVGKRLPLARLP